MRNLVQSLFNSREKEVKNLSPEIVVGILAFFGTLVGTFGGILTANRLSNYRIEQLEKKVDKHNTVIERMYTVESNLQTAFLKIDNLKEEINIIREEDNN